MDRLDGLVHWASGIDRTAQFEVIRRLTAIAPTGLLVISGFVNDPSMAPMGVVLGDLVKRAPTPLQRDGLFLALSAWLDVLMQDDGATFHSQIASGPHRTASGSSAPVTDEVIAAFMPHQIMMTARAANHWSAAVRSWKEFRHGAT